MLGSVDVVGFANGIQGNSPDPNSLITLAPKRNHHLQKHESDSELKRVIFPILLVSVVMLWAGNGGSSNERPIGICNAGYLACQPGYF